MAQVNNIMGSIKPGYLTRSQDDENGLRELAPEKKSLK